MRWASFTSLLLFAFHAYGQRVTNVTAEQQGQDLVISYDLAANGSVEVQLFVSTNRGVRWEGPLKSCSGDVGAKVSSGIGKRIRWKVLQDRELVGDGIRFKVVAKNNVVAKINEQPKSTVPSAKYKKVSTAPIRRGYVNHTSYGRGFGIGEITFSSENFYGSGKYEFKGKNELSYDRIEMVNGSWIANGKASLGLGFGFEKWKTSMVYYMPLFVEFRVLPFRGKSVPFLLSQLGYSVALTSVENSNDYNNRIQYGFGGGGYIKLSESLALSIFGMYEFQNEHYDAGVSNYNYTIDYKFMRIGAGLVF